MATPARRYLTVIQAAQGYPPPRTPLEPAPPDGPAQPVIHTVVLADDYEELERHVKRLEERCAHLEQRLRAALDG